MNKCITIMISLVLLLVLGSFLLGFGSGYRTGEVSAAAYLSSADIVLIKACDNGENAECYNTPLKRRMMDSIAHHALHYKKWTLQVAGLLDLGFTVDSHERNIHDVASYLSQHPVDYDCEKLVLAKFGPFRDAQMVKKCKEDVSRAKGVIEAQSQSDL